MSKELYGVKKSWCFKQAIIVAVLIILVLLQIFPFYLQLVNAFQPMHETLEYNKLYLFPVSFNFSNFAEAFVYVEILQGCINSLIVSLSYTALSSLVILLVGYVIGKKTFRGKTAIKFCMLLTMVVPGELLLVSNYLLISALSWTNSFAGLILPGIVNITGIFLVMSFMNTIPNSVLESADIDGAGEIKKIVFMVLPLSVPILATYWILTFVAQWNDYLWPMIIINSRALYTLQLKLKEFNPYYTGHADEVLKSSAHIISIIPVLLIYSLCQKKFVSGISVTGLK